MQADAAGAPQTVELRAVSRRFRETEALDHVTLQIREREFFPMVGPRGCGKTTLLRLVAGFERPRPGDA